MNNAHSTFASISTAQLRVRELLIDGNQQAIELMLVARLQRVHPLLGEQRELDALWRPEREGGRVELARLLRAGAQKRASNLRKKIFQNLKQNLQLNLKN